mgnify:CR=1 FL=1
MSVPVEATVKPGAARSPLREFVASYARSRIAVAALIVLLLILAVAVGAPLISPQNPYDLKQLDIMDSKLAPGSKGGAGWAYLLGTDDQGRDMLSAILYGLRISLGVGALSTAVALALGVVVGLIAAYAGGWTDALIMRLVDLQLSFPAILIALILLAITGQGVDKIVIALIAVQWAYYARTVRGAALVEKRKEYVDAAVCLGFSSTRIVLRHILPNVLPPLIVVATWADDDLPCACAPTFCAPGWSLCCRKRLPSKARTSGGGRRKSPS